MSDRKVVLMEFEQNPNIGIFMFVNNKFCLLGKEVNKTKKEEIANVLQVPVYQVPVLGTELVGVFIAGNDDFLLIPDLYDHERETFESITANHDMRLYTLVDKLNTLGNNVFIGEERIFCNQFYPESFTKELEEKTGKSVTPFKDSSYEAVGTVMKYINGNYYVSQDIEEEALGELLDVISGAGTINHGSNFIASGLVGNEHGLLLGSHSTTVEIQNVVESLDFLD